MASYIPDNEQELQQEIGIQDDNSPSTSRTARLENEAFRANCENVVNSLPYEGNIFSNVYFNYQQQEHQIGVGREQMQQQEVGQEAPLHFPYETNLVTIDQLNEGLQNFQQTMFQINITLRAILEIDDRFAEIQRNLQQIMFEEHQHHQNCTSLSRAEYYYLVKKHNELYDKQRNVVSERFNISRQHSYQLDLAFKQQGFIQKTQFELQRKDQLYMQRQQQEQLNNYQIQQQHFHQQQHNYNEKVYKDNQQQLQHTLKLQQYQIELNALHRKHLQEEVMRLESLKSKPHGQCQTAKNDSQEATSQKKCERKQKNKEKKDIKGTSMPQTTTKKSRRGGKN